MKAKRDYNLVVDGKFNRRAIMQRAYVYVRNYKYTLSGAMKMAWCDAHLKMDEFKAQVEPSYPDYPKAKKLPFGVLYSNPFGNLAMGYVTR